MAEQTEPGLPLRSQKSLHAQPGAASGLNLRRQNALAQAAAVMISANSAGFDVFTPLKPAKMAQGMLQNIHQLQCLCTELTGLAAASLVALSAEQAHFAALAMFKKQLQRKRLQREKLVICGDMPLLARQARQMGFALQQWALADLPAQVDDGVAAVVFPVAGLLQQPLPAPALIRALREQGVLILLSAADRYFLPDALCAQADIICLDLSLLCEVDEPCHAVLAAESLQPCLPVPYVSRQDDGYQWETLQQNPFSVGSLNSGAGHVTAMLQCLVRIRLQGFDALQQQARKAIACACYLARQLTACGFDDSRAADHAAGCYRIRLKHHALASEQVRQCLALAVASGVHVCSQMDEQAECFELLLSRLHYLSRQQLDELASSMAQTLAQFSCSRREHGKQR